MLLPTTGSIHGKFLILFGWLVPFSTLSSQVVISEFVASNSESLVDADGDASDWIEIHNTLSEPMNVEGFALTDDPDNAALWTFPAVSIPGKGFQIVFASGKDRKPTDGGELHTNFKLSGAGEYLALVKPDGETLETVFTPAFPPQRSDTAYGSGTPSSQSTVIEVGADCRWWVPASPEQIDGWQAIGFDSTGWNAAQSGVGYQYPELVGAGGDSKEAMVGVNASVFVRFPFELVDASAVIAMTLRMKFEDGFVAYLNGRRIAESNAPTDPVWNSLSTGSHPDSLAEQFEDFTVDFAGALTDGENVLAIHGMNATIGGSDLLVLPELNVTTASGEATIGYLATPTPGAPNSSTLPSFLATPEFSVQRGHYSEPFDLELTTPDADAIIYYTDDGDTPGPDDQKYTGAVRIEETAVIRAVAIRGDELPSPVATNTYLFVSDIVEQRSCTGA
ncbi:MAG: chitobiase/beta-hexosaminidase C-terminal domain-containing protein [Verrucomicrobiales bacterium]